MPYNRTNIYPVTSNFGPDWDKIGGVYIVLNMKGQVIYVGESDNFRRRHGEHFADTAHAMHQYGPTHVALEVISDERMRKLRERALIIEYAPPCNQKL